MSLDPIAQATVDAYLAEAADLIDGLYLYGSIALNDFRPGHSDIDFVALVSEPVDEAALTTIHTNLPGPLFDGIYLTREQLAAGPLAIEPTSYARDRGWSWACHACTTRWQRAGSRRKPAAASTR